MSSFSYLKDQLETSLMENLSLLEQVLLVAKQKGLTQKVLAQKAGISQENLSRGKKRGNTTTDLLQRLADAAGVHIQVTPFPQGSVPPASSKNQRFRDKHRTLVWSNPNASDDVFLQRALLRPQFSVLLDAALEYGLERLETEWMNLKREGGDEVLRASPVTQRILHNIRNGREQATA